MSDQQPGPGWWQASDGKWYPPEQATLPPPPRQSSSAPAKSTSTWKLFAVFGGIAVVAGGIALVNGVGEDDRTPQEIRAAFDNSEPTATEPSSYTVEYCWRGTSPQVEVDAENLTGGTDSSTKGQRGCLETFEAEAGDFLGLRVQGDKYNREVLCEIRLNNKPVETVTSSGEYATASCRGRI